METWKMNLWTLDFGILKLANVKASYSMWRWPLISDRSWFVDWQRVFICCRLIVFNILYINFKTQFPTLINFCFPILCIISINMYLSEFICMTTVLKSNLLILLQHSDSLTDTAVIGVSRKRIHNNISEGTIHDVASGNCKKSYSALILH